MAISQLELLHGSVITKICRSGKPVSLTLIEPNDKSRSAYNLHGVMIYIKTSKNGKPQKRKGNLVWQFTFNPNNIQEITRYINQGKVQLCLVCAAQKIDDQMEIVFIENTDIQTCLDLTSSNSQWMRVSVRPGESLRVDGPNNDGDPIIVSRNALDNWEVPWR
jgi:hypothetical protein